MENSVAIRQFTPTRHCERSEAIHVFVFCQLPKHLGRHGPVALAMTNGNPLATTNGNPRSRSRGFHATTKQTQ